MNPLKHYRVSFDLPGILLFLMIMLPNFIWFSVPIPNDILRAESVTPQLDFVASVVQAVMIAALCILINRDAPRPMSMNARLGVLMALLFYFIGWILYYLGFMGPVVILILCFAPCIAFLVFSAARQNAVAFVTAGLFLFLHLIFVLVNFLL